MGDQIEQEIGRFATREVLALIVDHLVSANGTHEFELVGVVYARDMRSGPFGELDGERPGAAAGAVDQHPHSGCYPSCSLEGDGPA